MNQITYCFDIDGTICTNTDGAYENASPFPEAVQKINTLYAEGHVIKLFTARGATTGINWRDLTASQMAEWGVEYHELIMGKPHADIFVDDKAIHAMHWLRGTDEFGVIGEQSK